MPEEPQNLFTTLGLDGLSPEEKTQFMSKIGALIPRAVILRIFDVLSDDDRKALAKLLEGKGEEPERIYTFLEEKVPNLDAVFNESIEELREELISFAK